MKINYEPWASSHEPQHFHRTDPTGRWSPLHAQDVPATPFWPAIFGGIVLGIAAAVVLYLWATI